MRSIGTFVALALVVTACSQTSADRRGSSDDPNSLTTSGPTGAGGNVISPPGTINSEGGVVITPTLDGKITSDAPGDMITVGGQPASVKFTVTLDGGGMARTVWSVDDTRIGSIGDDGVFHANGMVGGVVKVTGTVGSGKIVTDLTVNVDITENPGAIPVANQMMLVTGGQASDPTFRFLYPYDQTVFPRGLSAPLLQLAGSAATATYLKITAPHYSYQAFASAATPLHVTIPEPIWKGVTLTAGPKDAVTVAVTKSSGGAVAGPVSESWHVAQATLKGLMYYSTYKSPLAPTGGVLSLRPGQAMPTVVKSGCTVCHSVSANGNVLAAGLDYSVPLLNPLASGTFDLTTAGTATPRSSSSPEGRLFAFLGLAPDGSVGVTNGVLADKWPPDISRGIRATPLGYPSALIDTKTGAAIAAPSLTSAVTYAQTPAFSPDGKQLAFVNGDRVPSRVLSTMSFDGAAKPPAFSSLVDVVDNGAIAGKSVAWPTFLPDATAVVFQEGDSFDSYVFGDGNAPSKPQYAEIRMVETATKKVKNLEAINGHLASGDLYLPYGDTVEGRMNYEPNVIPVAVGGYYWVLFTSRRTYGNTIAPGGTYLGYDNGINDPWGRDSDPSPRKKLWIAAIDINHPDVADPSHPAFYFPGQEIESSNMRAFAALAPCQPNMNSCESGADCCGGFCRETGRSADGVPTLQCVPPPENKCSNLDEPCSTVMDCCDTSNLCINHRCTSPGVIN